jgi:N-acetyl-alpha-D-muramate 1-phosphate uridylyltransferase
MLPDTVMIFAAGRGTRMGALTDALPKPLIRVAGLPLIDRTLDLADAAGIGRKVVNTHYLGEKIAAHLKERDDVFLSYEAPEALETGGGMKQARPLIGTAPVFTLNPDAVWTGGNPLRKLAQAWRPANMSALLMLVPADQARGRRSGGDFLLDVQGRLSRYRKGAGTPYIYTGAQIVKTDGLAEIQQDRFSLNLLWDRMIEAGTLFGVVHRGGWADVGTPAGITLAERMLGEDGV